MSRSASAQISHFTPVPDALVAKFGLVTAAVFGRVWRYSQASRGVCDASQQKIADELGLDRVTVNLHIKKLVDGGYLKDRTPTVTNRPHTYAVTDKLKIEMTVTVVENNTGVVENNSTVNLDNSTVVQNNSKREVKRENKKQDAGRSPAVEAFRQSAKAYPAKGQWDAITNTVGADAAAVEMWGNVVAGYILKGWNPRNVAGMLDFYKRGEVPGGGNVAKAPSAGRGPMLPEGLLDG